MQPDYGFLDEAAAPDGGVRRLWRALNFVIEKPAGTASSTLVN
jgi:hypothetical protein